MSRFKLTKPVTFIIFNRPSMTARVFEAIRQAKPPQLLVVADGPRVDHPEDVQKCDDVRAVIDRVDWDCEVLTNFAENNMGCKRRVSSGLDWAFERVEEAIVLEDDCLPHPSFFRFCDELLERYRDDNRVMAISGDNFQFGRQRTDFSYYFSRYPHCWGWATWHRAWQHYDGKMELWPEIRDGGHLRSILEDRRATAYWTAILDRTYSGKINSWAYAWTLACWIQSGLTVLPSVNLVSNIGFGTEATHTGGSSRLANMPVQPITFPLTHPPYVVRNAAADRFAQRSRYDRARTKRFLRRLSERLGLFEPLYPTYTRLKRLWRSDSQ